MLVATGLDRILSAPPLLVTPGDCGRLTKDSSPEDFETTILAKTKAPDYSNS